MKSITAGLCLSLIGGVALAQTPPPPQQPKAPVNQAPPQTPQPMPPGPQPTPPGPQANGMAPNGPPEGEIIETPQGFFLVRPGQGPMPLDLRPPPGGMPSAESGPGDMDHDGMAAGEAGMPHPHPPRPHPEGKGARIAIHGPNLNLEVKCPDDEPMKACVDAIGFLLDKAAAQTHS